ncbi:N-alpha-acetyltransferase 40 [Oopsacas minuta]|uniref:N-alpha-acetyltransferase 40 n=1 Tax=Oopsacas minuta TaxID=111878 RepID=A0AAV7JLI2_9METZ|nr:N-alpha-acetyltransferase 40 [Oopsacas minuta]
MCASISKSASEALKRIKKANTIQNIIEGLPIVLSDPKYKLSSMKMYNRSRHIQDWVFDTIKANVSHFYDNACPWLDSDKRDEILHREMWNIIVSSEAVYLGFLNFRFDMDEDCDVVYLYEIQVNPLAQRKGIGSLLLSIVEMIAVRNNITKVILTSHRNNSASQKFFRDKHGYTDDESSPTLEPVNYDILSKIMHQ